MRLPKGTRFRDIPQITERAHYSVHIAWSYLERWLAGYAEDCGVDLSPVYQRKHVWTDQQARRYVEWIMRGGYSGKDIHWNIYNFNSTTEQEHGPLSLVDGKQRVNAVRRFLAGELRVFGLCFADFTGNPRELDMEFVMHINDLPSQADVMQWYLDMNSGGTVHSKEDLDYVRRLLKKERRRGQQA